MNSENYYPKEFIKRETFEKKSLLYDHLEKEESITTAEYRQAEILFDYLTKTESNKDLCSFMKKAIGNSKARDFQRWRIEQQKQQE